MPATPDLRRYSLLCSLAFAPGSTAGVRELRRDLERVHSLAASLDLVRGDLAWLAEQGLLTRMGDRARITERGQDVATRDAPWPGGPIHDHGPHDKEGG